MTYLNMDASARIQPTASACLALNYATEAINFGDVIGKKFGAIARYFQDTSDYVDTTATAVQLPTEYKTFVKILDTTRHIDLVDINIYVPEGFASNYAEYLQDLTRLVTYAVKVEERLHAFTLYVSSIVNAKDKPFDSKDFMTVFRKQATTRTELNNALGSHFDSNRTSGTTTYGKVIRNARDWETIIAEVTRLASDVNRVNRASLNKGIRYTSEMIAILVKRAQEDRLDQMTIEALGNISEGAAQCAAEIEFYVGAFYRVSEAQVAVQASIVRVTEIVKA